MGKKYSYEMEMSQPLVEGGEYPYQLQNEDEVPVADVVETDGGICVRFYDTPEARKQAHRLMQTFGGAEHVELEMEDLN